MNGGDEVLRLTIENPDETWDAANFDSEGLLYKAESGGDYSYRGDDPEAYDEIFDQETGEEDLTPLLELLEFLNESDDATFAAELPERLDVDAFAKYLAFQELVEQLRRHRRAGQQLLPPLRRRERPVHRDLLGPEPGLRRHGRRDGRSWWACRPVGCSRPPTGPSRRRASSRPRAPSRPAGGGAGMGGPGGRSNILVERFMANETFAALYEQALVDLRAELYDSGAAAEILERWTGVLTDQATDLVDTATIEQEASSIEQAFTAS